MGIPSEMRDMWMNHRGRGLLIPSPAEKQKILRDKSCTQEGVREGLKAAAVASVVTAMPVLLAVRMLPWAKANLNYTAQALIISAAAISGYFFIADQAMLACARRNAQLQDALRRQQH